MSDLHRHAVRLLARREHTRAELQRKLAPYGTHEEIESVLNELNQAGLQSDARFAESYLRSQAGRLGAARLRQTLRQKGVAGELVDIQLDDLPDEFIRARAVWEKRFSALPANAREWAKQARFLQGRGFSVETIRKVLKEFDA